MRSRDLCRRSPAARFIHAGLPGLLTVFLSVGVARGQAAGNHGADSANVVALVLSAIEQLPPRDSALRHVPWRVTAVDSTSRVLRAAAAGVAAAIGARPASERDSIQAVLGLWAYSAGARERRLLFEVVTLGRCGAAWDSAWAYVSSYEVVTRRIAGRWVTSAPTMIGHGDPTPCMPRPELVPDGPVQPPPDDSLKSSAPLTSNLKALLASSELTGLSGRDGQTPSTVFVED